MNVRKLLQIVLFSTFMLGLPFSGFAQGNLVNFSDWTAEAVLTSDAGSGQPIIPPVTNYSSVPIGMSLNSASFQGGLGVWYDSNGYGHQAFQYLLMYGQLNTVPAASYEVSGTLENPTEFADYGASLSFGDTGISLPETLQSGVPGYPNTYNFDTIITATGTDTTMSFSCAPDFEGGALDLYNLSVTEVPEVSTASLFFFGMCLLPLFWRIFDNDRTLPLSNSVRGAVKKRQSPRWERRGPTAGR